MKLALNIFGRELSIAVNEKPPAPPAVDLSGITEKVEHISRELAERERWESWQRNRGANGGQFGFAQNPRPVEYPHRTWEPR